jgi:Enterobacter phage Enc34, ssDNA-binding protein
MAFSGVLLTPPMTLESSALFTPKGSRLKPNDPPSYYARLLASTDTTKSAAWKALENALHDYGISYFGPDYPTMAKQGQVRSPIRTDVVGKGWPSDVVAFMNIKSGTDYKPSIVTIGPDGGLVQINDPNLVYPGVIVRASLRIFGYGGKGSPYQPGISFGLNNLQKVDDGPRLKTGRPDGSEFGGGVGEDLDDLLK